MNITIQTVAGIYVVPADKQPDLILWLQKNAIKVGQESVREQAPQNNQTYPGRQLINEGYIAR